MCDATRRRGRLRFFPRHFTEGVTSSLVPRAQPRRYTQELPQTTTQGATEPSRNAGARRIASVAGDGTSSSHACSARAT
jgi:hypothetical protein